MVYITDNVDEYLEKFIANIGDSKLPFFDVKHKNDFFDNPCIYFLLFEKK